MPGLCARRPRRVVAALLTVGLLAAPACSGDDDDANAADKTTTTTGDGKATGATTTTLPAGYKASIDKKLEFLVFALQETLPLLAQWREGKVNDTTMGGGSNRVIEEAVKIPAALATVKTKSSLERQSKEYYSVAVYLYREMAEITKSAIATPDADMAKQVDLIGHRVRILADRVFDRGRLTVDPDEFDPMSDAILIHRLPDVPDWEEEGQAAGPPLDDVPPPPPTQLPERTNFRYKASEAKWIKAVKDAHLPSSDDIVAAVHGRDDAVLRDLANQLDVAVRKLDDAPDPDGPGGRERAAAARLALLVTAEAARAAQAALAVPEPVKTALLKSADRLLYIGCDLLWDEDLGSWATELDPAILAAPYVR